MKTYAINQLCYQPIAVTVRPKEGLTSTEIQTPQHKVTLLLTVQQLGQVYLHLRQQMVACGLLVPRQRKPTRSPTAAQPLATPPQQQPDDDEILLLFDDEED
ncbi:MAG: hypothetical protein K2Y37_25700 [Pirellulales bacterium]|nr:hypothetical protein [Pirellulales bacterium]